MAELRIGVVGAGTIGRTHIATIAGTEGFRLAAVVDPARSAADLAVEHGVACFRSVDELIAAKSIDGAIVATPTETHVAISKALLEARLPVLVEKPIAGTVTETADLLETITRTQVPLLVGHHRRHNPIVVAAKRAIDQGVIGRLVMATVTCSLMKPSDYFDAAWRREPGVGGPLLINLIHDVDLMRHFFGDVKSVSATTSNDLRGFAVEDTAAAILRFERGGMATLAVSDASVGPWAWDLTAGENPERFPAHDACSHLFCGVKGGLSLPDLAHWTHLGEKDWTLPLKVRRIPFAAGDPYEAQLIHFGKAIVGQAAPLVSGLEGAKDLATIAAIGRAGATGRETPVGTSPSRGGATSPAWSHS